MKNPSIPLNPELINYISNELLYFYVGYKVKKKLKCVVCGKELEYTRSDEKIKCANCDTSYDPDIFQKEREGDEKTLTLKKLSILGAILAAFYLLFILSRIILY
ncbi:MAG: zinc finger domain-containing protein [Promethearchaeia archaeon]